MSQRSKANARQRQLAWIGTAAGVISLAGAGWYWYNRWSAPSATGGEESGSTSSSAGTSNRPRPSLSIHLSPSVRTDDAQDAQRITALYEQLAHLYLIHLIHHGTQPSSELEQSLSRIEQSDTRRILACSQHNGGIAITRALGCEAHLHVLTSDDESVTDEEELSTSLQLILKNPTLRLLVIAVVPPRHKSRLDIDSVLTSLQEVHSTTRAASALRVVDLRGDKKWDAQLGARMVDFRKAWR